MSFFTKNHTKAPLQHLCLGRRVLFTCSMGGCFGCLDVEIKTSEMFGLQWHELEMVQWVRTLFLPHAVIIQESRLANRAKCNVFVITIHTYMLYQVFVLNWCFNKHRFKWRQLRSHLFYYLSKMKQIKFSTSSWLIFLCFLQVCLYWVCRQRVC